MKQFMRGLAGRVLSASHFPTCGLPAFSGSEAHLPAVSPREVRYGRFPR
jgi:hypothetical protein